MREFLRFIIPNGGISQRKLFEGKVLFNSKEH